MKSILLALSTTILMAQPAHAADSPYLYGIHWYGGVANHADVTAMTGGRPIWSLETIMTAHTGGQWSVAGQKATFQQIVARGHTLIMRVQPDWGKAIPLPGDALTLDAFVEQAGQAAEALKDVCHVWQLGNEMNLDIEWGGQQLQPETYIDALAKFADRIRQVRSPLGPQIVLVGPLSPGSIVPVRWMTSTEYITRMCQALNNKGYAKKVQGFALHAYASPSTSSVNTCLFQFERDPGSGYQDQVKILDDHGFEDYPVYITEWNRKVNQKDGAPEFVSAEFMHRAFAGIDTWNRSGGHPIVCACWFVYADLGGWPEYSILSLKNNDTADHDVWHAFQFAAQQNYAAAYPAGFDPTEDRPTFLLY